VWWLLAACIWGGGGRVGACAVQLLYCMYGTFFGVEHGPPLHGPSSSKVLAGRERRSPARIQCLQDLQRYSTTYLSPAGIRAARHSEAHPRHQSNAEGGGWGPGDSSEHDAHGRQSQRGVGHKVYILVVGPGKRLIGQVCSQATACPPPTIDLQAVVGRIHAAPPHESFPGFESSTHSSSEGSDPGSLASRPRKLSTCPTKGGMLRGSGSVVTPCSRAL
jgi:hypothetical protein